MIDTTATVIIAYSVFGEIGSALKVGGTLVDSQIAASAASAKWNASIIDVSIAGNAQLS